MSPTTDLPSVAVRRAALEADFAPWQPRSLDRLLRDVAHRHPDRPVVISDAHAWTYAQMDAWVDRLATGLRAVGVRGGEHVGLILGNYPEFVAVKFAIARVGAVAVPINTMNRRDEIAFILRQADVALLVTMDQFRGLNYLEALDSIAPDWATAGGGAALPALRRVVVFPTGETRLRDGVTTLSALDSTAGALPPVDPSSLCDLIFTSGTTGAPKGVMLTHDMMLRTAYGSAYGRAFADGQRILFSLPLYHVFGYVEGLLAALFAGGAVVPQLKFTAEDTLEGIVRHGATDVLLVPTMSLALLDAQRRERRALPTLRTALASGGKAPAYLWDDLKTWLGIVEITTGYGMTECTASATVTRPDDPVERLLHSNGRLREVGAAGVGEPGRLLVDYRVVDPERGTDVAPGEMGELIARGIGVTRGYYKNAQATAAAFTPDGWLHTGDLGRLDADGYLVLMGRLKESYRCGGETVMPGDTEDCLALHPTVLQAHVVPVPDERMGEVGAAFVIARPGAVVDPEVLLAYCREQLARYKVPKYVLPIEPAQIPLTPSGRARKFLLRDIAVARLGLS